MSEQALLKILKNQDIGKAIPGGKYGAALMLKFSGEQLFSGLSLGRLVAFVSQALKDEVLIHIKTFIVLNQKQKNDANVEIQKQVKTLQEQILDILYNQPDCSITLA